LRGAEAQRAVDACERAMESGAVSSRHVRDVLRCRGVGLFGIERFLAAPDPVVRGFAAMVVARFAPDRVVEAILKEKERSVLTVMLKALEDECYGDVDELTRLLRVDDDVMVEQALQFFVSVGRADLLFTLAMVDDDEITERVKRYLNEQGWLK